MKGKSMIKDHGCSWIQVKDKVHLFVANDRSHSETDKIYAKLEELARQLRSLGYVLDTIFVLHDVSEEQRENALR